MPGFLFALQFLTIIPVRLKQVDVKNIPVSLIWFPLIGAILGLCLLFTFSVLRYFGFPVLAIDIIAVTLLIFLTGGMHLDGLADTFDAFSSGKNKADMLLIMRDPHSGTMGFLAVISAILLKIAFLYSINISFQPTALILTCVLSRWSMVFLMFLFPYARDSGKAKQYIDGINLKVLISATIAALILIAGIFKISGVLIFIFTGVCVYLLGKWCNNKISGITGDTIGAVNELIEIIVLFSVCVFERGNLWLI